MGVTVRMRKSAKGIAYWLDISNQGHRSRRTLRIAYDLPEKQRRALADIAAADAQRAIFSDSMNVRQKHTRNFLQVFQNYVNGLPKGNNRKYANTLRHMRLQYGSTVMTNQVTREWLEGWKGYLLAKFNGETPATMWRCTKRVLNLAKDQGLLRGNPAFGVRAPEIPDTISKQILSATELQMLVQTPMPDTLTCKAFLWCCFTGMARPEILALQWSSIDMERMQVRYKRTKTGKIVVVDLTETTLQWLPERRMFKNVFGLLPSDSYCHKIINDWAKLAGIEKRLSWYVARHSFAVLLLEGGADLLTVSKLLGHSTPKYTLRYLKLTDHIRRSAVDRLPVLKM